MYMETMSLYLLQGLTVGQIAKKLGVTPPKVRSLLSQGGIRIRRVNQGDPPNREPVCAALQRKGFSSFHEFVQIHGLSSFGEQATFLGVTEKSFVRVYESYRRLLGKLESSGWGVPSPQRKPRE